ncbi:thioredoxin-like protein [Panus rudis PR-1116 ss-1]|nr:thioredoxin-like protein [Panus rudis PR-1116 ss-1]
MQTPRVVKLIVFSDITCPWCYISLREMDKAMNQCTECPVRFEIEYRPYRLNASLKDGEMHDRREWIESRFGKEKADAMEFMISSRGEELGLKIKLWDGVITQTTMAHRLLLKAWKLGGQTLQLPTLEALFKAYFEDGQNMGDVATLARIAAANGVMSEEEAVQFLESDELLKEVEQMMMEVRRKGVTGVPFVVIDGKWAVSGGQSAETYVQIFKKIGRSDKPSPIPSAPTCNTTS